ncbi:GFA family protein [Neorhizobium sp. P12A]|uniref:GFA family protein n=1 Tax=Neorhizobium sp. P12A TaxID=2268027 RepID=UPI0011EDBB93|nr:GFA family protein [Neorhizobium sp. P12A]KAA0689121.1 GFA family protein [Neorhizobium sp. P12A]
MPLEEAKEHGHAPTHTGGCRCGPVRFEASGEPFCATYCHCGDCRRASGAPVATFVGFIASDVCFQNERGATCGNHPLQRTFCSTCGAPIAYVDSRLDDQIFFMLGAMSSVQPDTPKPRLVGIDHVSLEVGSIEEAVYFYGRIFSFELRGTHKGDSEECVMAFIDMGTNSLL